MLPQVIYSMCLGCRPLSVNERADLGLALYPDRCPARRLVFQRLGLEGQISCGTTRISKAFYGYSPLSNALGCSVAASTWGACGSSHAALCALSVRLMGATSVLSLGVTGIACLADSTGAADRAPSSRKARTNANTKGTTARANTALAGPGCSVEASTTPPMMAMMAAAVMMRASPIGVIRPSSPLAMENQPPRLLLPIGSFLQLTPPLNSWSDPSILSIMGPSGIATSALDVAASPCR